MKRLQQTCCPFCLDLASPASQAEGLQLCSAFFTMLQG